MLELHSCHVRFTTNTINSANIVHFVHQVICTSDVTRMQFVQFKQHWSVRCCWFCVGGLTIWQITSDPFPPQELFPELFFKNPGAFPLEEPCFGLIPWLQFLPQKKVSVAEVELFSWKKRWLPQFYMTEHHWLVNLKGKLRFITVWVYFCIHSHQFWG